MPPGSRYCLLTVENAEAAPFAAECSPASQPGGTGTRVLDESPSVWARSRAAPRAPAGGRSRLASRGSSLEALSRPPTRHGSVAGGPALSRVLLGPRARRCPDALQGRFFFRPARGHVAFIPKTCAELRELLREQRLPRSLSSPRPPPPRSPALRKQPKR